LSNGYLQNKNNCLPMYTDNNMKQ